MISSKVIDSLKHNRDKRLRGDVIAIPWSLARLSRLLPGVERGKYIIITASPKGYENLEENIAFIKFLELLGRLEEGNQHPNH
jgi:hypothetical protein